MTMPVLPCKKKKGKKKERKIKKRNEITVVPDFPETYLAFNVTLRKILNFKVLNF
jgi:hypothetical protein